MNNNKTAVLYVDENLVRIIAAEVIVLTVLTLFLQWWFPGFTFWKFPLLLLTGDFALRAFTRKPSPLAALAHIIIKVARLKPKPIFAAPKKFAAGLGFVFSFTVLLFLFINLIIPAYVVAILLIIAALLESVFKVCVGCYVFNWIFIPDTNEENNKKANQ